MIDLHVHSCRSDGTMTPTELVDYAIAKGLSAFALTDHDTVIGIDEALDYAAKLRAEGTATVPEVIPGIELSTALDNKDVHIVGLYINYKSDAFKEYLKDFVDSRDRRNKLMCERLTNDGYEISFEEITSRFPDAVMTRAHVATFLVEKGYCKSKTEAFEKFIGDRCPYYIPRERISPEEGVEIILKAGGIPVLAHPILYRLSDSRLEELVKSLKSHGLVGIEAVYSTYSPSEERQIRKLADKYDLRLSGGSDFHGSNKDNIDLGIGRGKLYVDDSLLVSFKEAKKNLLFTDMDGTLLISDSTISENMHRTLVEMTKKGHVFVPTSGRPLPSILERLDALQLKLDNTYVIANNGALIYDVKNSKNLRSVKLSPDLMKKIIKLCNEAGIHVHGYTDSEIVGTAMDDEFKFYTRRVTMPLVITESLTDYLTDGSYKCEIISLDNHEALVQLKERILAELGDRVEAFFSNDKYLEILPKGISKGSALLFLTDKLGMLRSHTFAAGDAGNDLSMVETAAVGVAMANADDDLKTAADVITKNDNNHDGLIEIIDKYFN